MLDKLVTFQLTCNVLLVSVARLCKEYGSHAQIIVRTVHKKELLEVRTV